MKTCMYAFTWESEKTADILETIAALDLKVARCRQLMKSMKICNKVIELSKL